MGKEIKFSAAKATEHERLARAAEHEGNWPLAAEHWRKAQLSTPSLRRVAEYMIFESKCLRKATGGS